MGKQIPRKRVIRFQKVESLYTIQRGWDINIRASEVFGNPGFDEPCGGPAGLWLLETYRKGTNLVLLSPDVAKAFPTEEAVNEALRSLIELAQRSTGQTKRPSRRGKMHG